MDDGLECLSARRICEYPGSQPWAVEGAVGIEARLPEVRDDCAVGAGVWTLHGMHHIVGIQYRYAMPRQCREHAALAAANPAGQANP